ncbi:Bug family tripartite tricarboxylate transporter substrate binding protein [Bradyrhizobium cytisi]|uniref:Bug family tripartite tricarboxylate transporter substrate binding protein n=1 Tax=Bradyrhizobium cytisi TaxID=515489 RepID=UPI001652F93D|nr:tripartite tricarboxylate transporter substrate-binding protein [Bradyrhizobium cytisi]
MSEPLTACRNGHLGIVRPEPGAQRSPQLADVPTARETGYPALEANEWFGVFVPANTPAGTVNRLNEMIRAVMNTASFKTALAKLSVDPAGETPKEFAQLIKSDFDRWGPIVRASGFTPED